MSKRNIKRLPHDFHLWTTVAATVDPLRRKGLLKHGLGTLPVPDLEPPLPEIKAPPKKLPPRQPFLAPYQAPRQPAAALPDKAVDPAIHKKVRRGKIDIDGTIDLHGMTQAEARQVLHRYISSRFGRGDRTILVITGKGVRTDNDYVMAMTERGILRTMLPIWLNEPGLAHMVSGWSIAARGHGGDGAWYVRLRRP